MRYRSYAGFNQHPIWIIIAVNFVLYIATIINSDVITTLGLIPAVFWERPWTILTSMFIHAGFWHIFANMLTFYFFGLYLSRLVGNARFLLLYFGGGILGGIVYLLLGPPVSIVVGASGAIFALAGALVVMMPRVKVFLYFIVPLPLWVAVLFGFVILSLIPGVAWQAHLGGLIAGLIAGYFFRKQRRYYYYR
jgi:membrane associated rhomboid family serine protease